MDNNHLKPLPHNPIKPVSVEHEVNDVVVIEGTKFAGDFFRVMKSGLMPNVLYQMKRNEHGTVVLHVIRTLHDACEFFAPELLKELDPLPASPKLGGASNLGEE